MERKNGAELLRAVKRFLETESLFDVSAVEKHFGLGLVPMNVWDPDKLGHRTFTTTPKQSLDSVLYLSYIQYRTATPESSVGLTLQVRNRAALCVRQSDVLEIFGARPRARTGPPPIRHFRTKEARAKFEAESVRVVDESALVEQEGRFRARLIIDFEVFECATSILISQSAKNQSTQ